MIKSTSHPIHTLNLILGILLSRYTCHFNTGRWNTATTVQVQEDRGIWVMVNFLGRLATCIRRAARLTFAAGRFHVMILIGQGLDVGIAIP